MFIQKLATLMSVVALFIVAKTMITLNKRMDKPPVAHPYNKTLPSDKQKLTINL
jgi:hypothetical protein